jgi:hypothetical protein
MRARAPRSGCAQRTASCASPPAEVSASTIDSCSASIDANGRRSHARSATQGESSTTPPSVATKPARSAAFNSASVMSPDQRARGTPEIGSGARWTAVPLTRTSRTLSGPARVKIAASDSSMLWARESTSASELSAGGRM